MSYWDKFGGLSFSWQSPLHFICVYTHFTLDSSEEGHICRSQNLSQFYFYIDIELNFILRFKFRLHLNYLAHLHPLITSF